MPKFLYLPTTPDSLLLLLQLISHPSPFNTLDFKTLKYKALTLTRVSCSSTLPTPTVFSPCYTFHTSFYLVNYYLATEIWGRHHFFMHFPGLHPILAFLHLLLGCIFLIRLPCTMLKSLSLLLKSLSSFQFYFCVCFYKMLLKCRIESHLFSQVLSGATLPLFHPQAVCSLVLHSP